MLPKSPTEEPGLPEFAGVGRPDPMGAVRNGNGSTADGALEPAQEGLPYGTISDPRGAVLSHSGELLSCAEAWPYRTLSCLSIRRCSDSEHKPVSAPTPPAGAPGTTDVRCAHCCTCVQPLPSEAAVAFAALTAARMCSLCSPRLAVEPRMGRNHPCHQKGTSRPNSRVRTARQYWRRGGDSNPRYTCMYAGLANLCFRPLSHLSGCGSPDRQIVSLT